MNVIDRSMVQDEGRPEPAPRCYRTFIRSATSWRSFASARCRTVDTCLTESEALRACDAYNANRSARQIRNGTMMEFTRGAA